MPTRFIAHMPHLSFVTTVLAIAALLAALAAAMLVLDRNTAGAAHRLAAEPNTAAHVSAAAAVLQTPAEDPSVPSASDVFKAHKSGVPEQVPLTF
jgi:hypothetical protein